MPTRGQKLFVRPVVPDDFSDLQRLKDGFLPTENALLGRLVGETVCFVAFTILAKGQLRIDDLFVAPELRRKRIGRVLLSELEHFALKVDCSEVVVAASCEAPVFFEKMGFSKVQSMFRKSLTAKS